MKRFLCSAIGNLCAAPLLCAQDPQSAAARAPERDALLAFVGAYVIAPRHELVVALQQAPGFSAIVLYDIRDDLVRVLFPAGRDTFFAGPELAQPQPEEFRVTFGRDGAGRVTGMRLSGAAWPEAAVAQRRNLRVERVTFSNGSVSLAGDVVRPPNASTRLPAVVLVHGSEASDRYSFSALPYLLASHGFVTFMFDKRGTGASTGEWSTSGLDELAQDVHEAFRVMARRADVDPRRIGLIGVSEGGWTAPLAASLIGRVSFIVAISGGGLTKGDAFIYKNRVRLEESGLSGAALDSALADAVATVKASRARVASASAASGFDRRIMYDPTAHWRAFRGPILSLGGEADALEDAPASARNLREVLTQANHPDFTIKVFPRAHHAALFLGRTGRPSEWYGLQGITQVAPGYWDTLLRWLEHVVKE